MAPPVFSPGLSAANLLTTSCSEVPEFIMSQASLPAATASDSLRKVMPALLSEAMKFASAAGGGEGGGGADPPAPVRPDRPWWRRRQVQETVASTHCRPDRPGCPVKNSGRRLGVGVGWVRDNSEVAVRGCDGKLDHLGRRRIAGH